LDKRQNKTKNEGANKNEIKRKA